MSANSGPGYRLYPQHRIAAKPAGVRVQARLGSEVIADSDDAIKLEEAKVGHVVAPVVYYFPRRDVNMARLVRTEHHTDCPFKGHASYYSIVGGPENAAWTYEAPYDEMLAIDGLIAFYPDKLDVEVGG